MIKRPSNWEATMIALAQSSAEQLEGTCKSIIELGEEFEDATDDRTFCAKLDELVFECQICNWWFEQSEMAENIHDEWICKECHEEGCPR